MSYLAASAPVALTLEVSSVTVFPVPTPGVSKAAVMLAGSMVTVSLLIVVMLAEVTAAFAVPS